ncbi:MAG: bifunctional folylpolyglutamate synthase/dihydrofolate synthase [Acidimicrobiia bacterium]|nr:bifunctional folylpolyglutamate synthase/dihydrofolate synthase [Acidimicrobiia bacterium]
MTRDEAIAYLDSHIGLGVKPGLERISAFLETMGNPHLDIPVVHITGTNGKTSTSRLITAILRSHGLSVGTFTSPHLEKIEERFTLDSVPLSVEDFLQAVSDVKVFADVFDGELTYFELTAAVAFTAFANAAVDVAVIEVGLGGRLDATNVVQSQVAVITTIGLEHTEYLGNTLHSVATEKAAIVKAGSAVVTGDIGPAAEGPVTARVTEVGATWKQLGTDYRVEHAAPTATGWLVDIDGIYDKYSEIELALRGRYQATNLATAVAAAEEFFGRALDKEALRDAATIVINPGRLEVIAQAPLIMIDGAHNVDGMRALASALREEFPTRTWTVVLGVLGDKNLDGMIEALAGLVSEVVAVAPISDRAQEASVVAAVAENAGLAASTAPSVAAGIEHATALAGTSGAILVTGSLYTVGEARTAVKRT